MLPRGVVVSQSNKPDLIDFLPALKAGDSHTSRCGFLLHQQMPPALTEKFCPASLACRYIRLISAADWPGTEELISVEETEWWMRSERERATRGDPPEQDSDGEPRIVSQRYLGSASR
jgi:hypothetical protein